MVLQEDTRPKTWDELYGLDRRIIGQKTEKDYLKEIFKEDRAQCVIFHGPPGTGKTSAAYLCAETYLGSRNDRRIFITNASDDRGISMVRFHKDIASRKVGDKRLIFIIDEFDGTRKDAQKAFNAIIEQFSNKVIFIFIVNDINRVIEPIISRSAVFKFPKLHIKVSIEWFKRMCDLLKMKYIEGIPEKVLDYYDGDLRSVVCDFFTKYKGEFVKEFNPYPTFAEKIFKSKHPYQEYLKLRKENYIDAVDLLEEIFILNNYQNPMKFSMAIDNLSRNGRELINVCLALTGVVK